MATIPIPKPTLEGIQTVPPSTVTDPRTIRHVSLDDGGGLPKGCLNVVLFYGKVGSGQDSGWTVAGWMKDSLARAQNEQPLLSGRVSMSEEGAWEVVSNDSGARLLEATIPVSLKEFMEMEEGVRGEAEADLVFWKEVDQITPHFSPLLYVQVTNFKCGGYSIGISCSLLLADLLITDNFLNKWGKIQREISNSSSVSLPIFYLPYLKPNGSFTLEAFNSTPTRGQSHTLILKTTQPDHHESETGLANSCIEKANCILGSEKAGSSFRVVDVKGPSPDEVLRVNKWRGVEGKDKGMVVVNGKWEDLGLNEVSFYKGNKPVGSACWVGWKDDEVGLVMTIKHGKKTGDEVIVVVAIPDGENV